MRALGKDWFADCLGNKLTNQVTARTNPGRHLGKEKQMTFRTIPESILLSEQQSIDARILEILEEQGAQSLDHLDRNLSDIGSARLLFAIDRLSRTGQILIGPPSNGEYLVSATPATRSLYTGF